MTIWKYTLRPVTTLEIPNNGQILDVQMQHGEPQIWVLVDPTRTKVERTFHIHGTGHTLPRDPGKYIATFQMDGGSLVFHVFEV